MTDTQQYTLQEAFSAYGDSTLRIDVDCGKQDLRLLCKLALCVNCVKYACELEEDVSKRPWRMVPESRTCPFCSEARVVSGAEVALINAVQDAQRNKKEDEAA